MSKQIKVVSEEKNKLREIFEVLESYSGTIIDMEEDQEFMHLLADLQEVMEAI